MNRACSASTLTDRVTPRRPRVLSLAAATAAVATLAACTTTPLSYIDDRRVLQRNVLYRYPVRVVAIDGASQTFRPVPISPGDHRLTIDAPPVAGFALPIQKIYPMTIAPCTRYYVAAQRTGPFVQDWDLVLEDTWPVAGCDPAKELEKAKIATTSDAPTASASRIEVEPRSSIAEITDSRSAPR